MKTDIAAACGVRLTLRYPFWSEVYYSMEVVEDEKVGTAATDGRTLWINRMFWSALRLDEQVGLVAHELCHKIFLHCTRRGSRDPRLWNEACDLAINPMLQKNGFTLPKDGLLDMKYDGWLAEAIYADLLKQEKAGTKRAGISERLLDIRTPEGTPEEIAKVETEVQALVDRAIMNAKAHGKLPAGIEQGVVQAFKPLREAWYNALHRFMQSLANSEYNWARLNRRTLRSHGVFTPLHQSEALGDIAVFIDASGSVFDRASQSNFAGHLNAILSEAKPRRVHVYYFDTRCYPGEVMEAGELEFVSKPRGGGGTMFEPIFEQLEQDGITPEVAIVLTDLEGSFPAQAPEYPVVWASIEDHAAPFGDVLVIE